MIKGIAAPTMMTMVRSKRLRGIGRSIEYAYRACYCRAIAGAALFLREHSDASLRAWF